MVRGLLLGTLLTAGAVWAQATPPPGYLPTPPPNPYGPPAPPPQPVYAQPVYAAPTYTPPPPPKARGDIEIGAFVGWMVSTDASTFNGNVIIDGATAYGGTIDYSVRPGYGVELFYAYIPTKAQFASFAPGIPSSDSASVGEHWIQIGGNVGKPLGRIEPYGVITAGIVIFHPSTLRFQDGSTYAASDQVRFAFTAGLGLKVWLTESIGLRFEARALVPVYFSGAGFWVGTGGASVGLSGGIPFAQFDFTGGISFKF